MTRLVMRENKVLNYKEAIAALTAWHDETGVLGDRRKQDILDLMTYLTIRFGDGRSLQKAGKDTFRLYEQAGSQIPASLIEEFFGS